MSRRAITYERAWSAAMLDLFDLVGADWTPPSTVKVRRTVRGMTITAVVVNPAGMRFTARARIRLRGAEWVQVEETLGFSSTLQGAAL